MATLRKHRTLPPWQSITHIVGPQGSGKTLVGQALQAEFRKIQSGANVTRISGDDFSREYHGDVDYALMCHDTANHIIFEWQDEPEMEVRAQDRVIRIGAGGAA